MLPAPFHLAAVLAETAVEADRRGMLRYAFGLWIGLAAIGLIAVAILWLLASSLTRKARGVARPKRRRRIADAWAEAGRRVEPLSPDDMQPDAGGEIAGDPP